MVDDFWSMDRCSQDSDGKGAGGKIREDQKIWEIYGKSYFPEDEGSQKGAGDGP